MPSALTGEAVVERTGGDHRLRAPAHAAAAGRRGGAGGSSAPASGLAAAACCCFGVLTVAAAAARTTPKRLGFAAGSALLPRKATCVLSVAGAAGLGSACGPLNRLPG